MNATDLATDIAQRANLTQRLINDVLHSGTPAMLMCATCGKTTEHRDLKMGGCVYTVCRHYKSMTTSA